MRFRPTFVLLVLTAFVCVAVVGVCAAQSGGANLSRYRNRNRLALVFAPSAKDAQFQKQMELWKNKEAGFADRQLIAFSILESGQSKRGAYDLPSSDARALRKRYNIPSGAFRVLLIGKDGNDAYSSKRPVVLDDLFGRIDKMPMRRDEMRKR